MSAKVSVVIPTYNERENITPLVEQLDRALSGFSYEAVFVDDDSKDGTAELIRSLAGKYPVRVVVRQNERGLASAVVEGIKHVSGDTIVVMDADLQHPPEVIPSLVAAVQDSTGIAIASRYVKGGGCEGWSAVRKIVSKGAIFLTHLLLPATRGIKDPMSGFFAFGRQVVANANLRPTGYKIILEILYEGRHNTVAEVPYIFRARSRGESKLNARQYVDFLRHTYSLMKRKGELTRFLKFCLVGGSGVGVNEGFFWIFKELVGLPLVLSNAMGIEVSIISNYVLNDFFTFRDRRSPGIRPFFGRMGKFNLVSVPGWGINTATTWLLTHFLGDHYYLLFNLVGIALAMLWNFSMNSWWTWQK
ncbi:MAG: glycosyltransferase [Chloroflexi bacterium]|nr:glycosyltransferase [Chloroflexota bacterium]